MRANLKTVGKRVAIILAMVLIGILVFAFTAQTANAAISIGGSGDGKTRFESDYDSAAAVRWAGRALNEDAAASSMILLKNEGNALPFKSDEGKDISVFGFRSNSLAFGGGGSGSGGVRNPGTYGAAISLSDSLTSAGFNINPTLSAIYPTSNAGIAVNANSIWENATYNTDVTDADGKILPGRAIDNNAAWSRREYGLDVLTETVQESYGDYDDAAVIVLYRYGSEGLDYMFFNTPGHADPLEHYYSLDDNEHALINHVTANFDKVVVVINSGNAMEIPELEDNDGISAVLWMGYAGESGAAAVGKILNGSVNPSGKTADVWGADFQKEPVWENLGASVQHHLTVETYNLGTTDIPVNRTVATTIGDAGNLIVPMMGSSGGGDYYGTVGTQRYFRATDKNGDPFTLTYPGIRSQLNYLATLEYEEGIYVGYKWYETAHEEGALETLAQAELSGADYDRYFDGLSDTYYNRYNGVVYPFGHGLSYTSFKHEIINKSMYEGAEIDKSYGATIKLQVKVTNTGRVAGRDVVQAYYAPEYTDGGIEKATVNLIEFGKTGMIAPGQSEIVKLSFKVQDISAYDYNDANGDGHTGYELDPGTYSIGVYKNSHESYDTFDMTVSSADAVPFDYDTKTGELITNLFTPENDTDWDGTRSDNQYYTTVRNKFISPDSQMTLMSRGDFIGTYPAAPTEDDLKWSDEALLIAAGTVLQTAFNDVSGDPWYVDKSDFEIGGKYSNWTQAANNTDNRPNGRTPIQLWELSGKPMDHPLWTSYMNQLTWSELVDTTTAHGSRVNISIGKPQYGLADGPAQMKTGDGTWWCSGSLLGTSWDKELLYKIGVMIGEESLWSANVTWYGPAANFHRSNLGGRNFEFYSQDGVHGGMMGAMQVKGFVSKGGIAWMKHVAMNDAETYRMGASTWANEQAMRELYYRQFEIIIKDGNANATMSSYARIGLLSSTNDHTYNKLLCDQWGFDGINITDAYYTEHQMAYIGMRTATVPLGSWSTSVFGRMQDGSWDAENNKVISTFRTLSTSGAGASVTPNDVQNGGSVAYKNNYSGKLYPTDAENFNPETGLQEDLVEYEVGDTVDAYSHWVAIRSTVQRLLYTMANSNTIKNGLVSSPWTGAATNGTVAASTVTYANGSPIFIPMATYATVPGEVTLTYVLTSELPEGLSFDPATGNIFGTAESGEYVITVRAYAGDTWAGTGTSSNNTTNRGYAAKTINLVVTETGIADLETDIADLQDQINDLTDRVTDAEDDISAINTGIDSINSAITALDGRINVNANDITAIKANIVTVEGLIDDLDEQIAALEADLAELGEDASGERDALAARITTLETAKTTLDGEVTGLKDKVTALEDKVKALEESGCNSSINIFSGIAAALTIFAAAIAVIAIKKKSKTD